MARSWALFGLTLFSLLIYGAAGADDKVLWIDVRSADEYAAGHLEGALNIPYDEIAVRIGKTAASKDTPIKLYCGIGVRAQMAKVALEAQGYRQVSNEGGYAAILKRQAAARPCGSAC